MGFVVTADEAQTLIDKDLRNQDVLFPYLNGEDLNSRPDQSASRWVINFRDWPLDRSARGSWTKADQQQRTEWRRSGRVPADYPDSVAADFPDCFGIVEENVRPERQRRKPDGSYQLRTPLPQRYWQYADKRPELYDTIEGMQRVLTRSRVADLHSIAFVSTDIILNDRLVIFATDAAGHFTTMQSGVHETWARRFSSTLRTDMMYAPVDCFETYPMPPALTGLSDVGERYVAHRAAMMSANQAGLTATYRRFHDPKERGNSLVDLAVARAYGWTDLKCNHGFHTGQQGIRFMPSASTRQEILDRLLELNHQRYADEVAQGLHEKAKAKSKTGATRKTKKSPNTSPRLDGM
jgi:hypothetical protein